MMKMPNQFDLFQQVCPDLVPIDGAPCSHYIKKGLCTLGNHFRCPEYIIRNEPALSFTAIDDYSICHRKFFWGWYHGLQLVEKSWPLQRGGWASKILGWLHSSKLTSEEAVSKYKIFIEELIKQTTNPEDENKLYGHIDIWKMKAIFDVYIEMEMHTLKGTTEYEFRWNEPDLPKVHGFIDLVEFVAYDHFGYEFKWTSDADNYRKFVIEDQLRAYFIGDPDINRMTVRCFVPPDTRQKSNTKKQLGESIFDFYERMMVDIRKTATERYFVDRTYWRTEFDLEDYKNKAARTAKEIINYLKEGGIEPFYQNKKACDHPFNCDFKSICENGIKDPFAMEIYKRRNK